jgi:hypothetical protein
LLAPGVAGVGVGVVGDGSVTTGVSGVVVCADVEAPEPSPPQAASVEERTTEQKAKRIHEPLKVLIMCDPVKMTQPVLEPNRRRSRGEACVDSHRHGHVRSGSRFELCLCGNKTCSGPATARGNGKQ